MRALLDLIRDNAAAVQDRSRRCQELLLKAARHLSILDPELGDMELIKLVAVEYDRLLPPLRKPSTLNPQPQTLNPKP